MARLGRAQRLVLRDGRELTVCSAAPADARAVRALLDAVAAEPSVPILHLPGGATMHGLRAEIATVSLGSDKLGLVGFIEDELVGHLMLAGSRHPFSPHVCELGFAVADGYRRIGVASALLDAALEWAARKPFERVAATVLSHNRAALDFLAIRGFRQEGLRVDCFRREGRLFSEVLLALRLPESGCERG